MINFHDMKEILLKFARLIAYLIFIFMVIKIGDRIGTVSLRTGDGSLFDNSLLPLAR